MEKKQALRFNKIVDKFLNELHNILPNEKDIVIFQSQISVATMMDPTKILRSFIPLNVEVKIF